MEYRLISWEGKDKIKVKVSKEMTKLQAAMYLDKNPQFAGAIMDDGMMEGAILGLDYVQNRYIIYQYEDLMGGIAP